VWATHYRGGEVSYRLINANTYELNFWIYNDCHEGDAASISQDLPLYLAIFSMNGTRVLTDENGAGTLVPFPMNNLPGCYRDTNHYCGRYAHVQRNVNLPVNAEGYLVVNQRCCIGDHVTNIASSYLHGLTLRCMIPGTNHIGAGANSSPAFRSLPPLRMCIDSRFDVDYSAFDSDGDSLVYRLESGLGGGSFSRSKPVPANINFYSLPYAGPSYSYMRPLGKNGSMFLNSATGALTGYCSEEGEYLVCVACDEYRGGKLIGSITRAYVIEFEDCNKEVSASIQQDSAVIKSGIDTLSIVRCKGARTVDFKNTSSGAVSYHWDFGVSGASDDTSTLADPQFTYPAAGRYQLMLIAYGQTCTDTLRTTVWISDDVLTPDFNYSGGPCLSDTVTLEDNSTTGGSTIIQYLWETGNEAFAGKNTRVPLTQPDQQLVTHVIISEHDCLEAVEKDIPVKMAAINGGHDTVVVMKSTLYLEATGGVSYNWLAIPPGYFNNYIPGGSKQEVITETPGKGMVFVVTGKDAQGCGGVDTVHVTISEQSYVFVPTAFTPNGDGRNDFLNWRVSGGNLLSFSVYNRQGNEVFYTTNPQEGWDGRHKGQEAAQATYYWMLRIRSGYSGNELVYSGDVFLVR
jgi:gliding motility-associated-like protein